ncbi:hypothetical protein B0H10DRAFT_2085769 [Mycena sp. CBHHK59/15]|nr:hypothetical protein B0H10DRAFT_2085769 [Mycena sp. CBHHK59/15]
MPRAPSEVNPAAVGVWLGATFTTVAQAANLLLWSDSGCPWAWAVLQQVEQDWALRPLARRSEGVGLLLSSQKVSRARYFLATTGAAPPSKKAARAAARATASAIPVADVDVEMTAAPVWKGALPPSWT